MLNQKATSAVNDIFSEEDIRRAFGSSLRPRLAHLLQAFGLDIIYHRAIGDSLYYYDEAGLEVEILDMVGGFGSSLFGHNNPELISVAHETLSNARPFNAQASVRSYASLLARELSSRVGAATGCSYVVTLASTGTEAVEAAIKHAELERFRRNERLLKKTRQDIYKLQKHLLNGDGCLSPGFFEQAAQVMGGDTFSSLDALLDSVEQAMLNIVNAKPLFLAVEGSFHGKSTGALKLTHRLEFRKPWERLGIPVVFVPREDTASVRFEVERARKNYFIISYNAGGEIKLERRELIDITACFCEPIQGEGGIFEHSREFMQALRYAADSAGCPLIMDEIQCGMGRCGEFLASSATGVNGDYYLLSKSLGGGLAKTSALLIDRKRYDEDLGYLHTSTFADDDHSSAIALRALEILGRNDNALIEQCHKKGEKLLERLNLLWEKYPNQIGAVRGRGLMIGVEIKPQTNSSSSLLRVLSEQKLLTYLAAGYLLHEHKVRIVPTLSDRAVLRIEPSAYISDRSCAYFCAALDDFFNALRKGAAAQLVSFVIGRSGTNFKADSIPVIEESSTDSRFLSKEGSPRNYTHVGFLAHFTEAADLCYWEPNLRTFASEDCKLFLDKTQELLHPFIFDEREISSATGELVRLTVIGIPFTSAQAVKSMRDGKNWCLDLVEKGINLAHALDCTVVGLGGYTSIVSDSGRSLNENRITLTSGNSLTVAAAHDALFKAAERIGLDRSNCQLGVVGGAGNVGASMAELAADKVGKILLVGRRGSERFLHPIAKRIYGVAFQRICAGHPPTGIAAVIADTQTVRQLLPIRNTGFEELSQKLYDGLEKELGTAAPIRTTDSMHELQHCELVVLASNAPRPIVGPEHIGSGRVVICDVAVPQDIDSTVKRERPNAVVLRGGIVRAPLGQKLGIPGMQLSGTELYGCLAETILLGFVKPAGHYSYGSLATWRIRQIREWAQMHGFEIGEKEVDD